MAIAFVQSAGAFGLGTNVSVSSSADSTAGNLIVASTTARAPITSIGDPDTLVTYAKIATTQDTFGPTTWGDIWWALAATSTNGFFSASSTSATSVDKSICIAEYSGCAASPFDQSATGTDFSTAALTAATATTAQADELIVGMIGNEGGTRTVVPDGTFTERQDVGQCSTEYADKIVSATGTYTYSGTVSGAASVWVACIATFKSAGGGGGPTSPTTRPAFIKKREPLQQRMGPC